MERRQQLEELFHDAIARPAAERAAFLLEACASDPKMRSAIESLISAHEESGGFLDHPPFASMERALAEAEAESLVGTSIGEYKVLEFITRGGMGSVYLARDKRLERRVALKLLPEEYTEDQARLRRFILEAKSASSLNHPNIITIHEIGHVGTVHFIAAEFVEGQTLRRRISRGLLPLKEAVDFAMQVASALSAAHSAGIVHRDIKPENIMIRPDGYVKVLDFGLAKLVEATRLPTSSTASTAAAPDTDPGTVIGTTRYMSPEQTRGVDVDRRTDTFSLGVVIYEMITGTVPFSGETRADVMASILRTDPVPMTARVPGIPPSLVRLVGRALEKDRARRYQTAEEMLTDLRIVEHELEMQRNLALRIAVHLVHLVQAVRASLAAKLAAAVLVAMLAAGGVWVSRHGFHTNQKPARLPDDRPRGAHAHRALLHARR